jgi:hydroxyacylglutathione hydrolase
LGLRIAYSLDTHLHNDFVSGAREIAAAAGARIGASAEAGLHFDHLPLSEGSRVQLGELSIRVLATPGHTPEHISFTISQGEGQPPESIFTGGALIAGGAARTDLLGEEHAEAYARDLYKSIHQKLVRFPDEVSLYPTHGAGSFCAAPAVTDRTTTIGQERAWNPLVQTINEDEFVTKALSGLPSYPMYFKYMRRLNQVGPALLGGVPVLQALDPDAFHQRSLQGAAVLDTRPPLDFMAGHIPGAFGIPLSAPLITWAGWVIPFGSPILLVSDSAAQREAAVRNLIRIGYDDLRGYLEGGMAAWEMEKRPVSRTAVIHVDELQRRLDRPEAPVVLDVRSDAEWQSGRLPGAFHIEAGRLPFANLPFPEAAETVVHCGHADRSTVAISVLERRGFRDLALLEGGIKAWRNAGLPVIKEP